MDIRRVRIKDKENATVLNNDLIRVVIQDHNSRLIEFSAMNIHGGWVNCNKLHRFPFSKDTVLQETFSYNSSTSLMDKLYGCQLQITLKDPIDYYEHSKSNYASNLNNLNYDDSVSVSQLGDLIVERELKTKEEKKDAYVDSLFEKTRINWMVQRYGVDDATGGVWVLSKNINFGRNQLWEVKKLDVVLPNQPVLYSSIFVKNISDTDLNIKIGFDNTIGAPFLESDCLINSSNTQWNVLDVEESENIKTRIKKTGKPFSLDKAPIERGGYCDAKHIQGLIGTTDVLYSKNELENNSHIWQSIINPKQQMVYLSFALGNALLEDIDIPLTYSTMLMDFGGRFKQPWTLYEGGTSNEFSLHLGAGSTYYGEGNNVTLHPGEVKRIMYAKALISYDNVRLGNNFYSFEAFNHNIVLKRTKSSIVIPSDPQFKIFKKFCEKLVKF